MDQDFDASLVKSAIQEIEAMVNREHSSGEHSELNVLLEQLLNANTGLCGFGPNFCRTEGDPESKLRVLFEQLISQPG